MEHCCKRTRRPLEILPIECWESIFNQLEDGGLEAASLVCKDFLEISNFCKIFLQVVHPQVGMLSKLLKRFKQLKKISFKQFRGDLKEAVLEIARFGVSLNVLEYNLDYKPFDYSDLVVIANSFPNLEKLQVAGYYTNCPIDHCRSKIIDDGVEYAASKLKLLKKIHMCRSRCVSDRSVVALSLNCAFLKSVKVYNCYSGLTETGIGTLLRNLPNLEALTLGYLKIDSSQSAITLENSICHAKSLNSLKFSFMDVSDMLLSAIAKANLPLRKFCLKYCRKFTVEGILSVLSNCHLTKLCILGDGHRDSYMKLVLNGDVGNLIHIDIRCCWLTSSTLLLLSTKCPLLTEIRMKISDLFAHYDDIPLSTNHNVRNICLRYSRVDEEWFKQLPLLFPNIRVLDLSSCYGGLTCTCIEVILKNCKFIRKLILEGYGLAKLVKHNSEFPELVNLEDLDLSDSLIEDEGLSAIAEKCCRLVSLNLKLCKRVTMEGIKNIVKKVTTLKCISIRSYHDHKVNDLLEWMLCRAKFASLKKIYLGNYGYTEKHKEEFMQHGCLLL